jgi:serine/threonine-protein kinase
MVFSDGSVNRPEPCRKPGPFGRFYLQELINSGGMADLFHATDQDRTTCAMRLLRPTSMLDFTTRSRFLRGCEILSRIHNHEHVIGYMEHGKIEGIHYCQMEYVEGANLKQLLVRGDEILQENVGNIIIDMARALEHVHDSGFMHLDFKPENVLVTRNGGVRLIDFDLAQPRPEKPQKSAKNPGTPAYMAPEQLLREPFDHRVDIYAFGVSAYEVLTGQKPFVGDTADDILRRQKEGPPKAAIDLNPAIPPGLSKVLLKCLDRDPDKRYPIMSVAVLELENILYVN